MSAVVDPPSGEDDPLEQQRRSDRDRSEGTSLPSEGGLGPGAGEGSPAESIDAEQPADPEDIPSNPSLRGIPNEREREGPRP